MIKFNSFSKRIAVVSLFFSLINPAFAVPVAFFTDIGSGLTAFTNAVNAADTNYNSNQQNTPVTSTVYSFTVPDTSATSGVFQVNLGGSPLWIKTTQAGSDAPNDREGNLGNWGYTGWGVFYGDTSDPSTVTWANALAEGYKVQFFTDAGLATRASINAFGIHIDDWGTCCTDDISATPSGTSIGTGVFLAFESDSTTTTSNVVEVGTMTTELDEGTEHFVGAIDDRASDFHTVTLVPTGIGEYFGVGSVIYFSTVQIGSALASSNVNTVTSSAVDITPDHTKVYTDLGGTLNRVFAGGTLSIPSSVGSTFTDSEDFTVNDFSGNTLEIDSGVMATFDGIFSGSGGLAKTGTGTLIFEGANTYTGSTTVSEGTFLVGSSSSNSAATVAGSFSVASGATLAGYGTVGAAGTTLTNSGIVSPGNNSIGTLSVNGAYVQNSGGNLSIGLTSTNNDLLAVTEQATLAGSLTVSGSSGSYSPTRYTLMTSGGRTGIFDALASNLDTFTTLGYFLSYDNNNVYLTLGPDYINTTTALRMNFEQIKSLSASQAVLQISGLSYDCSIFGQDNICLSTGGRTSHVLNNSDAYNNSSPMTTSALLIGAYRLDSNLRIGGWIDENINSKDSNIKMSNSIPMIGAFGVYSPSGDNTQWQVKLSASYVEKDLDIKRQQLINTEAGYGKTSFRGLAAQLEVAYGFSDILPKTIISPVFGLRYFNGRINDYTEETPSVVQVPITYDKFRDLSTMAYAGLRLEGNVTPELRYNLSAGVETDIEKNDPSYSGRSSIYGLSNFNLSGNSEHRDTRGYASVGASYLIDKTQSLNFGIYYRQDQFKKVESLSSMLTYTVGF